MTIPSAQSYQDHFERLLNIAGLLDSAAGPARRQLQSLANLNREVWGLRWPGLEFPPQKSIYGVTMLLQAHLATPWRLQRFAGRPQASAAQHDIPPRMVTPDMFFADGEAVSFWVSWDSVFLWALMRDGEHDLQVYKVCGVYNQGTRTKEWHEKLCKHMQRCSSSVGQSTVKLRHIALQDFPAQPGGEA